MVGKNPRVEKHTPPHFPFDPPPFRLSMGLLKVPEAEWFEIYDLEERATQLNEKRKLLASQKNEVFIADPAALSASEEVLELMVNHLPSVHSEFYSRTGNSIKVTGHSGYEGEEWSTNLKTNGLHPLDLSARLVQEDLAIMLPPEKGFSSWWLAGGSIAFPSRWSLKEKFRKTMDVIHSPVPFYEEQLQNPTNNFFDSMPLNEIFSRRNWSLHESPALRQDCTSPKERKSSIKFNSENVGEKLWLRVERQTLRKLAVTGAILFTIRIHLRQLNRIVEIDGIAERLSESLSALPKEMHEYKQTDVFADSVQAYLNQF